MTADAEQRRRRDLNAQGAEFADWAGSGGTGQAARCNGADAPPPRSCYASPEQIAAAMLRTIPEGSTVYVATGVSDLMLKGISQAYELRRRPPTSNEAGGDGPKVSYADALVDREVCLRAKLDFVGHSGSTFSKLIGELRIAHGRRVVFYDKALR
jgi:hypothetical protein